MQAMTSFGGGDGWLAPDETGFTTTVSALTSTGATERSLAYSQDSNHLYVTTRGNGDVVMILDANTAVQVGALDMTGVGGGDLGLNSVSASIEGHIYATNVTVNATNKPFRIYRWIDEVSPPEVVYEGVPLAGARVGDNLDIIGSASNTRLVAGHGGGTVEAPTFGYSIIDPNTSTATHVDVSGALAGDFRLGITFAGDANNVWGTQGGNGIRRARTTGVLPGPDPEATATLVGTMVQTEVTERPLDFAIIRGVPLLATIEAGSTGAGLDNDVRIYDMTDPAAPILLATANLTNAFFTGAPGQGTGGITFGAINEATGTATLYAMGTNNGIQAFNLMVVPEPGSGVLIGLGTLALLIRRRPRNSEDDHHNRCF